MLWNEECYVQLETCSFWLQIFPHREDSPTRKEIKTERMGKREWWEEQRWERENCEFHNYLKLSSVSPSSLPDTWVRISESNQKTLSSPEVLLSLSVSILYSKHVNLKAWIKNTTNVQVVQLCLCTLRCVADTQWYVIMPGHGLLRACLITVGVKTGNHIEHTHCLRVLYLWHQSPSHCLRLSDLHNQTQNQMKVVFP